MQAASALEVGQTAPDFALKGPGGAIVTLSEYRGKKNVVLIFFPSAFSGVCSLQLPQMEKRADAFEDLDAVLIGVSVDNHFANDAFAKHLGISYPLLSDFKRETSAAYGVLNPELGTAIRSVFVIDKQGRVAYRDISPAPGDPARIPSADRAVEALRALQA